MDTREELKHILLKKNIATRKLAGELNAKGFEIGTIQNFSNKLRNKTIRFSDVDYVLEHLGYKIEIKEAK